MHKKARFMIFSLVFVFILGLHSYAFAKPEGKGKGPQASVSDKSSVGQAGEAKPEEPLI